MKRRILRFSEKISKGLSRPAFKLVSQMIYDILAAQSCQLSKIGRTLNESTCLNKTIDRLSASLEAKKSGNSNAILN